ncbi:HAD-IIB family hydrolase [Thermodesulfobacteriota bacterium]
MKIVVFTDLDATLLDARTYSWHAAKDAIDALKKRQAAIVLVSSKTTAEMERLHWELELEDPFVVENGGGIVVWKQSDIARSLRSNSGLVEREKEGERLLFSLGAGYDYLTRGLGRMSVELGCKLHGFAAMSAEEIADLTGLKLQDAARAKVRDFDEPFLVPDLAVVDEQEIVAAAARIGYTAVQGGRFWHLMGHGGKGHAVSVLIDAYRGLLGDIVTIGLGDSPNDFDFLQVVRISVFVGETESNIHLPEALKAARRTTKPGPEGWNEAMLEILAELEA